MVGAWPPSPGPRHPAAPCPWRTARRRKMRRPGGAAGMEMFEMIMGNQPNVYIRVYIYIHIYIHMYTYVYICIYMYMYIWYVYTIFMHTFNTHKQWYVFRTCSQVKLGDVWVSEAASHKQWEDIQQLSPMIAWFDYITNGDPNTKVLKEDKEGRSLTAKSFKEWLVQPSWCINVHSIHSGLWDPQTLWCLCSIVT